MDLIKGECWEPKEDSDIISWKKEESSRRLTVANYPLIKIYHIVNVIRVNGRVNIRSPRTDTRSSCIYAFINQWNRTQESLDPTPYPYEHLRKTGPAYPRDWRSHHSCLAVNGNIAYHWKNKAVKSWNNSLPTGVEPRTSGAARAAATTRLHAQLITFQYIIL